MTQPSILQVSFTPIERDARVLRQLGVLAEHGAVTTIGFGPTPRGATEHLRVDDGLATLPQTVRGVAGLAVRAHTASELLAPALRQGLDLVGDRTFDLVVANDARALPFAFAVANGSPVWADLHEWAPEERTHVTSWRLLVAPLMRHLCAKYLPQCAAVTTVGPQIAELYARDFGVDASVIRNAPAYQDLAPTAVPDDTIRLVHSGAAVHGRNLESMIDAVRALGPKFPLDIYLVPAADGGAYLRDLKARAEGCPWISFPAPVEPGDLPSTLNAYDVGVFWIPPTHTNARLTLPNKFFDFVQARLAVAVGPSIEMSTLVHEYQLGVVADDFTVDSCIRSITSLSPTTVAEFKRASDAAANDLSFESEARTARTIITRLLESRRR